MKLDEFQLKYNQLLADSAISAEMITLLSDWAVELIKKGLLKEAQKKMDEYLFRAFQGDMDHYQGFQFFSFRSFSEYSLNDIKEDHLSLSHPEEFNDPLDTVLFTFLQQKIKKSDDTPINTRYCMLLKAAHQLRMRCFVRTTPLLNEDGTYGLKDQDVTSINPLMWAHYAKNHTGFCALYELNDKFVKADASSMSFTRMAILDYKESIDINKSLSISDALLWKNAIWDYEHEVRVIDYDLNNKERFKEITAPPLKSIYLGLKCSDENRHKMEFVLRRKNVALYQMRLDPIDICKLIPERIG